MIRTIFFFTFFYLLSPLNSFAISVSPMEIYGNENDLVTKSIKVTNSSKYTEYVRALVYEIVNPGTPEQREVSVDNSEILSFSIFPRKIILSAGESKSVRLLYSRNENVIAEKLYRVRFIPTSEFSVGVTVKLSYGVLVRVLPLELNYNYKTYSDGKVDFIENSGNVRVHIKNKCKADIDNKSKQEFRLYPGSKFAINKLCSISDFEIKNDAGKII
ncbi:MULTISPECIES: hypothetical protein [unclassified Pseudoalteromonas]|uniref:hypothetical protein n=1 Tax=unclassified Pseudoalteromonas TaxID=194690 RepID=UPI001603CD45|nr:hypothetical protein [Pseudoalteromonas sp. SG43-6]MBB1436742.1 hypothetical protein [Pseudoalteromonas sp. SG43-6]